MYLIFLFHGQFEPMLRAIIQKLGGKGGDRQVRKPVTAGAWLPACLHLPEAGGEWALHEVGVWSSYLLASILYALQAALISGRLHFNPLPCSKHFCINECVSSFLISDCSLRLLRIPKTFLTSSTSFLGYHPLRGLVPAFPTSPSPAVVSRSCRVLPFLQGLLHTSLDLFPPVLATRQDKWSLLVFRQEADSAAQCLT